MAKKKKYGKRTSMTKAIFGGSKSVRMQGYKRSGKTKKKKR